MKILITGATGLIGSQLGKYLVKQGHEIVVVSRDLQNAKLHLKYPAQIIEGDLVKQKLDLPDVDAVINLIGDNIGASRWTEDKKREVVKSRVGSVYHLFQSLKKAPQVFIQATAIGIYGDGADQIFDETSPVGQDFLAQVCQKWEDEYKKEQKKFSDTRFITARLGVVFSSMGGAFLKMLLPFEMGFGQVLGSGKQWMSWVHVDDVVGSFDFFLNSNAVGEFNICSPESVTNLTLTHEINQKLGSENIINKNISVPKFALKLILGEMSDLVLTSQRVSCDKLVQVGYKFKFNTVEEALDNLLSYHKGGHHVFETEQYFDQPIDEVFKFFSEANNLDKITPPLLKFKIIGVSTPQVQTGTIIEYTLKVHQIPIRWITEIKEWNPPHMFSDNQIKGPYKKWYHTHSFEKMGKGTIMTDRVQYVLPLGWVGDMGGLMLVKKDIQEIFNYRRSCMTKIISSF